MPDRFGSASAKDAVAVVIGLLKDRDHRARYTCLQEFEFWLLRSNASAVVRVLKGLRSDPDGRIRLASVKVR